MLTAPVYLIHGFLGDRDDWQPVIDALDHRLPCVPLELPGHATACDDRALSGDTFDEAARQLAARVASTPTAAVVGYSMGGRVALRAASLAPDAFAYLLLVSAQPGIDDPVARDERADADRRLASRLQRMDEADFRTFIREWYAAPLFGGLAGRPDFLATVERRARHDPRHLAAGLRVLSVGLQPPLWNVLSRLGGRCRYLFGDADAAYAAVGSEIRRRAPAVPVHEVRGAAHALHREAPAAVADHLLQLIRLPASP